MSAAGLVFIALPITIIYGFRSQKNMAPMAITFAFLIGCGVMRLSPKEVLKHIPISIIFNIVAITFFFGFGLNNGALMVIVDRALARMQKHPAWIFPVLYFITFLIALLGAGIMASAFMTVIAFAISKRTHTQPLVPYVCVVCGTTAGSNFIYSAGGTVVMGMIQETDYAGQAFRIAGRGFLISLAVATLFFFVVYILFGGYKCTVELEDHSQVMTPVQETTISLILIVAAIIIIPQLLNEFFRLPWLSVLCKHIDAGFIMTAGGCAANLLKLGDDREILGKNIPWRTIMMLSGISMLVGVGEEAGMVEILAHVICSSFPVRLITPVLAGVAGIMSIFSSAIGVVLPTLFPLVPALSYRTGVNAAMMYSGIYVAATMTGTSPISTNGSMAMAGCQNYEEHNKLFYESIFVPFILLIIVIAICFICNG